MNRLFHRKQPLPQKTKASSGNAQDSAHPNPPSVSPGPPPEAVERKYSGEEWAQYFKPGTFTYPPPPPRSPARGLSRKRVKVPANAFATYKRSSPPKHASVSSTVDDADEDLELTSVPESLSSKTSGDGSAMDIDPATPLAVEEIHVNAETKSTPKLAHFESRARPPIPPRPNQDSHAEKQEPHMNLGDLKNVAPFAPNNEGLKNLNDLSSTLPFESRPSTTLAEPPAPQPLSLPGPPKVPDMPQPLTQNSWERYMAQMRNYMFEWNAFNTKMLAHFNERQASVENTLKPQWMSAIGDGSEKWGYKAYMQGVEEDFRVREHWNRSWDKHRECMRRLGSLREKLLGGSLSAEPLGFF